MIDPQFFVPCRHGVGAKHIDLKLLDEPLQQGLAFLSFEVDSNGLLADIGRHKITVSILSSYRSADVSVGIAFGFPTGHWSGLQLDHTPA